ncbi:nitroreductase [bacterium]|nr:nitroreductase [bacterium]
MNEILKAMRERRSIRKFKAEMPAKADLEQIVEAGLYAASGKGQQAAIIVAITNKEIRGRLSRVNCQIGGWQEGFDPFYGAPAILLVLADKSWVTSRYDGSLVMGNMMLAAHSLGLGSIWIHRAKEEFAMEEWQSFLKEIGVEGEWEGIGHCAVGYMDCELPAVPKRKDGRVFWVE